MIRPYVLLALALGCGGGPVAPSRTIVPSTDAIPIIDPGGLGLYADGTNTRPDCMRIPDLSPVRGLVGVASLGMSAAALKWNRGLLGDRAHYVETYPSTVRFAKGACKGCIAYYWSRPGVSGVWGVFRSRLVDAGLGVDQVRVLWVEHSNPAKGKPMDQWRAGLEGDIDEWLGWIGDSLPNLELVLLSPRSYGGYATNTLSPEPYAFEHGVVVRNVIGRRECSARRPTVDWGPYLWANGSTPNADGTYWLREDYRDDGTHVSSRGARKAGAMIHATLTRWLR